MLVALIVGVHRDGGIAEHGLGPRGGDDDELSSPFDRITKVPEMALGLSLLDFEIGNRGEKFRVPIDQALIFVDEPSAMELDEDLAYGARKPLVHGEAEPRPIAGGAQSLQLADDGVAGLFFPLPDPLDELFAAQGAATQLLPVHPFELTTLLI